MPQNDFSPNAIEEPEIQFWITRRHQPENLQNLNSVLVLSAWRKKNILRSWKLILVLAKETAGCIGTSFLCDATNLAVPLLWCEKFIFWMNGKKLIQGVRYQLHEVVIVWGGNTRGERQCRKHTMVHSENWYQFHGVTFEKGRHHQKTRLQQNYPVGWLKRKTSFTHAVAHRGKIWLTRK